VCTFVLSTADNAHMRPFPAGILAAPQSAALHCPPPRTSRFSVLRCRSASQPARKRPSPAPTPSPSPTPPPHGAPPATPSRRPYRRCTRSTAPPTPQPQSWAGQQGSAHPKPSAPLGASQPLCPSQRRTSASRGVMRCMPPCARHWPSPALASRPDCCRNPWRSVLEELHAMAQLMSVLDTPAASDITGERWLVLRTAETLCAHIPSAVKAQTSRLICRLKIFALKY
jgi:hypothetical protein